jgi:hypothetical protein
MDLLDWQEHNDLTGPILEIGVFAGRYLSVLLRAAKRKNERVVGIDTFEWVSEKCVIKNLHHAVPEVSAILVKRRSVECDVNWLRKLLLAPPRFVSIDGSHEAEDVLWDLDITDQLLAPQGIVAVDDFLNPLALGVNQAVNYFFSTPRQLAPVAYIANKLFLTRPPLAATVRGVIEATIAADDVEPRSRSFRQQLANARHNVEVKFWDMPLLVIP